MMNIFKKILNTLCIKAFILVLIVTFLTQDIARANPDIFLSPLMFTWATTDINRIESGILFYIKSLNKSIGEIDHHLYPTIKDRRIDLFFDRKYLENDKWIIPCACGPDTFEAVIDARGESVTIRKRGEVPINAPIVTDDKPIPERKTGTTDDKEIEEHDNPMDDEDKEQGDNKKGYKLYSIIILTGTFFIAPQLMPFLIAGIAFDKAIFAALMSLFKWPEYIPVEVFNMIRNKLLKKTRIPHKSLAQITDRQLRAIYYIAASDMKKREAAAKIRNKRILENLHLNKAQIEEITQIVKNTVKSQKKASGIEKSEKVWGGRRKFIIKSVSFIASMTVVGAFVNSKISKTRERKEKKDKKEKNTPSPSETVKLSPDRRNISFYFTPHTSKSDAEKFVPSFRKEFSEAREKGFNPVIIMDSVIRVPVNYGDFIKFAKKNHLSSLSGKAFQDTIEIYIQKMSERDDVIKWHESAKNEREIKVARYHHQPGKKTPYQEFWDTTMDLFSSVRGDVIGERADIQNGIRTELIYTLQSYGLHRLKVAGDLEGYINVRNEVLTLTEKSHLKREELIKAQVDSIFDAPESENKYVMVLFGVDHEVLKKSFKKELYAKKTWIRPIDEDIKSIVNRFTREHYPLSSLERRKVVIEELAWIYLRDLANKRGIKPNTAYPVFDPVLSRMPLEKLEKMIRDSYKMSLDINKGTRLDPTVFSKNILKWLLANELNSVEKANIKLTPLGVLIPMTFSNKINGKTNKKNDQPETRILRDLSDAEETAQTLLEEVLSLELNKTIVLAFDDELANSQRGSPLRKLIEALEILKRNKSYEGILKELKLITAPVDKLSDKLKEHTSGPDTQIFLFARASVRAQLKDIESSGKVHASYIIEDDFNLDSHYPLAEIVVIALAEYISPSIKGEGVTKLLESRGQVLDLDRVNIEHITKNDGALIFKLLPNAERFDKGTLIKNNAQLKRFLRAA